MNMAEAIETRWDGITTVAATAGLVIVTTAGLVAGTVSAETLLLAIGALSGIGGYSMHNVVKRGGAK
jgi:hypothetical protein